MYNVFNAGDGLYQIIEHSKDNEVIAEADTYAKARHIMKQYNSGMGFGGWTPSFMLKKMPIEDIEYEDDEDDILE